MASAILLSACSPHKVSCDGKTYSGNFEPPSPTPRSLYTGSELYSTLHTPKLSETATYKLSGPSSLQSGISGHQLYATNQQSGQKAISCLKLVSPKMLGRTSPHLAKANFSCHEIQGINCLDKNS